MPAPAKKYRPYFTLEQLRIIMRRLSVDVQDEVTMIRYLDDFVAQIEYGIRKESHKTKGRTSVIENLGLQSETNDQYRYENDLMSSTEEAEYEKRMGIV